MFQPLADRDCIQICKLDTELAATREHHAVHMQLKGHILLLLGGNKLMPQFQSLSQEGLDLKAL
jgi:hypothetical protein